MRLVVDDDEITPAAEHSADHSVRVLLRAAAHGAKHRGWDEPPLLDDLLGDPVVALSLEWDALPVADDDVRMELVVVLRRHHVEGVVEVVLAGVGRARRRAARRSPGRAR